MTWDNKCIYKGEIEREGHWVIDSPYNSQTFIPSAPGEYGCFIKTNEYNVEHTLYMEDDRPKTLVTIKSTNSRLHTHLEHDYEKRLVKASGFKRLNHDLTETHTRFIEPIENISYIDGVLCIPIREDFVSEEMIDNIIKDVFNEHGYLIWLKEIKFVNEEFYGIFNVTKGLLDLTVEFNPLVNEDYGFNRIKFNKEQFIEMLEAHGHSKTIVDKLEGEGVRVVFNNPEALGELEEIVTRIGKQRVTLERRKKHLGEFMLKLKNIPWAGYDPEDEYTLIDLFNFMNKTTPNRI